jgi:hypothetical protein
MRTRRRPASKQQPGVRLWTRSLRHWGPGFRPSNMPATEQGTEPPIPTPTPTPDLPGIGGATVTGGPTPDLPGARVHPHPHPRFARIGDTAEYH